MTGALISEAIKLVWGKLLAPEFDFAPYFILSDLTAINHIATHPSPYQEITCNT